MSYHTDLYGAIRIAGVPEEHYADLCDVITMAGGVHCLLSNLGNERMQVFTTLDSPYRVVDRGAGRDPHEVEIADVRLDAQREMTGVRDKVLLLVGTDYIGGTRSYVPEQINWVLSWLKKCYPEAKFSGQLEEWDCEAPGNPPTWYVLKDGLVEAVATKIVPLD